MVLNVKITNLVMSKNLQLKKIFSLYIMYPNTKNTTDHQFLKIRIESKELKKNYFQKFKYLVDSI